MLSITILFHLWLESDGGDVRDMGWEHNMCSKSNMLTIWTNQRET